MKKILTLVTLLVLLCSAFALASQAADYYVYDATDIVGHINAKDGVSAANDYVRAEDTLYTGVYSSAETSAVDGTEINILLSEIAQEFHLKEYPIMKLGYRSNVADTGAQIDFNFGVDYAGTASRIWGVKSNYDKTGVDSELTVDISGASGGEGITGFKWASVDSDSYVNYIRIKPYYEKKAIKLGEYFDIEYVAFFKNTTDASNFHYNYDFDAANYDDIYLTEQVRRAVAGDTINMHIGFAPSYMDAPSDVLYSSSNTSVATVNQTTGEVTCISAGNAEITASCDGHTSKCKIIVLADEIKPVEFATRIDGINAPEVKTSHLGDSITTYSPNPYAPAGTITKPNGGSNYHDWWGEWFYVDNEDKGISGSSFTAVGQDPFTSGRIDKTTQTTEGYVGPMRADADLVTVKGGTNDSGSARIGDLNDRSTSTYMGAARYLMESLIERYPDKQIVFFTPIHRSRDDNSVESYNRFGESLQDISAAMVTIGEIYDIPVIDIYNPEQLDFSSTYISKSYTDEHGKYHNAVCESDLMPDGLHPSGKGHMILAEYMINEMVDRGIIKATKLGDVNRDGEIDIIDLIALSRNVAGWEGYEDSTLEIARADLDYDGEVGALDVLLFARHVANWNEYYSIPYFG